MEGWVTRKGFEQLFLPAAVSVRDRTGEGDLGPNPVMIGVRLEGLAEMHLFPLVGTWCPGGDSSCLLFEWHRLVSKARASPASVGALPTVGKHPLQG